jgi:hypothetical protein
VAALVEEYGHIPGIPQKIQMQIDNANRLGRSSARSVRWEVGQIREVLGAAGIPFVLLKGAAYEMAGLPPARGRIFVDVDIMVARESILNAEKNFIKNGWTSTKLNAYDQKYYRNWMHEIPPLQHIKRGSSLDVHHTILPPTAGLKPDVKKLWAASLELPNLSDTRVLGPKDMVLHSATHLFHDGDLQGALRDLVDIDALIRHFSTQAGFMEDLLDRAREMDLLRPLYYVLRYSKKYLNTPVPGPVISKCELMAAPPGPIIYIMDTLVARVLFPEIRRSVSLPTAFSKWLLYVRSHYLRMPLHQLLPHLVRKALVSEEK